MNTHMWITPLLCQVGKNIGISLVYAIFKYSMHDFILCLLDPLAKVLDRPSDPETVTASLRLTWRRWLCRQCVVFLPGCRQAETRSHWQCQPRPEPPRPSPTQSSR